MNDDDRERTRYDAQDAADAVIADLRAQLAAAVAERDRLRGYLDAATQREINLHERAELAVAGATEMQAELHATLAKYQSDIDKLAAAIIDHPNVPGGFIETVVAHIWAMRRGIAQLTTQHVITLNRAAEMTGLNLQQVRQWAGSGNMRRDADTQSTDCSLASKLLGLSVVCCATCHHDDDGDLIEIGIRGDSYWVCCAVNAAAFAPQQVNRHNAADQARVRPAAALSAVPEGGDGAK